MATAAPGSAEPAPDTGAGDTAPEAPAVPAAPPAPLRDHVLFGAFVPDAARGVPGLPGLEARLGARLEIASMYTPWGYVFGGAEDSRLAAGGTRRVVHSWEPFNVRFRSITDGSQDAYLQRIVTSMRAYPHDVWVRPWPEMNASWSTWQPTPRGEKPNGGTATQFVAAWRHVVTFVRSRGVHNLRFVFNPDSSDAGRNTAVPSLWPGAEYVDAIGLDGYNWGDDPATGHRWTDFEAIFAPMYDVVTSLPSPAPVWITELGSKEPAMDDGAPADRRHRKGEWMERMLASTRFPRLEAVAWFNVTKERDWRLESSADALAATTAQLASRRRPVLRG